VKLLLDTQLLLWAAGWDGGSGGRLSGDAATLIDDMTNELFFSAASIWEIAIKRGLGRDDFRVDPHVLRRGLMDSGYAHLPIESHHALGVLALPQRHEDPFDRILIAQATIEGLTLLTADAIVAAYPGPIRKV
jgi:PIN domain nuclease of toxin-antitoxin system